MTANEGSAPSVAAVLARIVTEVDSRGPEGHWLSKTSPLMAQARVALLEERLRAERTTQLRRAAERLASSADQARKLIEHFGMTCDFNRICGLLDAGELIEVLRLSDVQQSRELEPLASKEGRRR